MNSKRASGENTSSIIDDETWAKLEKAKLVMEINEKKDLLLLKADGASSEITKQDGLAAVIEANLSKGLEDNEAFQKKAGKIDKKKNLATSRARSKINGVKNGSADTTAYVFDDEARQAMKRLEEELIDPFARGVYEKMSEINKQLLLEYLVDHEVSQDKSEIFCLNSVEDSNYNVVRYSDNGYLMQLTNKKKVLKNKNFQINNKEALFNIVSPDGKIFAENLDYDSASNKLEEQAAIYQKELKDSLALPEAEPQPVADNFLDFLAYVKYSGLKKEELTLTEKFINLSSEQKEIILSIYKKGTIDDVLDEPVTEPVDDLKINFDKQVLLWANKMGVKANDLEKNQEFLELGAAEQVFVLGVLNRSSLAKIKVEANYNFEAEKKQKKWYQLGFAFNQNFHKKKHEILAAKNIHEKGLEGYGEAEFSWLTSVIKNGPEIKIENNILSVNYLHSEIKDDKERQSLIAAYNIHAYNITCLSPDDKKYGYYEGLLNDSREALLSSAKDGDDGATLAAKLVEAEKQIKLHHFLKGNPETEKIIKDLNSNSLNAWTETKMMIGGQKDKLGYAGIGMAARMVLRSEEAIGLIGRGFTYAVGPVVASLIGGYRANVRASKSLDEKAELAKLGVRDDSTMAKNLNLAVGQVVTEGKLINLGLSDKLESLSAKFSLLKNKIDEVEKSGGAADEDLVEDFKKVIERLNDRIDFTTQKMTDGLVSFGEPKDRALNYYKLLNSLEAAKTLIFSDLNILNYQVKNNKIDSYVTNLTRSNHKIDLAELHSLSVEDRLSSFLDYNENQRQSAEFKYLLKETAKGAVLGASFAAAGAWIFEHTGLGDWTSAQLSQAGKFLHLNQVSEALHINQALNSVTENTRQIWGGAKNLFTEEKQIESAEVLTKTIASDTVVRNLINVETDSVAEPTKIIASTTGFGNLINTPEIETADEIVPSGTGFRNLIDSKIETPSNLPEYKFPEYKIPVTTETSEYTGPYKFEAETDEIVKPETYSDEIKSGGSVWRSTRNIFKSNPEDFGYQGDSDDGEALNRWAETQTANTLHNSGDVNNLVHAGNRIILAHDGDQYKISVEQGEGVKPGHIDYETESSINLKVGDDFSESATKNTPDPFTNFESGVSTDDFEPIVVAAPEVDPKISALTNEAAKFFHLPVENIKLVGNDLVYQSKGGKIIFDSSTKAIKEVFDASNKSIPKEFVARIKGRAPIERFARRGGLDKILTSWNKLKMFDKSIYEMFRLKPEELVKRIGDFFEVKTENLSVGDESFVVKGHGRSFDKTPEGVKKLVKFLSRK